MNLYQYCCHCGNELADHKQEAYADAPLEKTPPPLCQTCINQYIRGMAEPMAELAAQLGNAIQDAFQPLIKSTEINERRIST